MFSCLFPPARAFGGARRVRCLGALLLELAGILPSAGIAQGPAASPEAPGYRVGTKWKPGGEGAWSGLTLDSQSGRLYLARARGVQIIDVETGRPVREIPGLESGGGVALAPELSRGYATSRGSNSVLVFDLASLRPFGAPIAVGQAPGAIVYEPLTRRVFVFNAGSRDASVIDPATGTVVATIALSGVPKSAAADEQGALFVVLEDKNEVLVIDAPKNKVTHRWPLAPGAEPAGLALDAVKRRLFVGCGSGLLIVLDAQSGRRLAALPIGKGVGACAFDPGAGLAFAAGGDGTLAVVQEDPAKPGEFRVAQTVATARGASTMALDPRTHAVYLAAADFEAAPGPAANGEPSRAQMTPGSFALLKVTR